MTDQTHTPSTKNYSYAEIGFAVAEAEYALSLLSLDLLRPSWGRYFELELSADEIVVCSDSARNPLIDYRRSSEALEDTPDYVIHKASVMRYQLGLFSTTLERSLGTSIATQVNTWMDEFSRLSRQDGFSMAWSTILLSLRNQDTAVVLRHLGIIEALPRLQEIGHAYATFMDQTDCEIEKLQAEQKSEWDQQEFKIYAGESAEFGISLLDTLSRYLWVGKKEELRLEILKILGSSNQLTPFRQWAEAILIEEAKIEPYNFDPPTLYNLLA
jgi:hypothetical protein